MAVSKQMGANASHNANESCGTPPHEILEMWKFKGVQSPIQQIHGGKEYKIHWDS